MIKVTIGNELKTKNNNMALGIIQCNVQNSEYNKELWNEINNLISTLKEEYTIETITKRPQIADTRQMYLRCGKKPSRYRPAGEQLMRRIIKGVGINNVNTLVDLVNLISLKSGYSIGGFDADIIVGDIVAGIGKENEPYNGIGRGALNIHLLPVLRDQQSAIGTPTSDEVRTALSNKTSNFLMCINAYSGNDEHLKNTLDYSVKLLEKYANATDISVQTII